MKNVYALLALMLASTCFAQTTVGLHIGSLHGGNPPCDNNINPGFYVSASNGLTAGVYVNSCERRSEYIGWKTPDWHGASVLFGGFTGYEKKVTFIPLPTIGFGPPDNHIRLSGGAWNSWSFIHLSRDWTF